MKLTHTKVAPLAAALVTFGSLAGGANAANILVNGDFSSSLTGWNIGNSLTGNNATAAATLEGEPVVRLNGIPGSDPDAYITQTFATTIGETYEWSINHRSHVNGGLANSFAIQLDIGAAIPTTQIFSTNSTNAFTTTTGLFTATATQYTIGFFAEANGTDGSHYVDNASVTLQVPEPSSTLLLGLGLLGITVRRKRTV